MSGESGDRELWREARRRINDCETRKAELRLDEQSRREALKQRAEQLAHLKEEVENEKATQTTLTAKLSRLREELLVAEDKLQTATEDAKTVRIRLEETKTRLSASEAAERKEREEFDVHLREQAEYVQQWTRLVTQGTDP